MEKKKYSKPVVVAERFEPQEYVAACEGHEVVTRYRVYLRDIYTRYTDWGRNYSLYQDKNSNERFDNGEEITLTNPRSGFTTDGTPEQLAGTFYTRYHTRDVIFFHSKYDYEKPAVSPVYKGIYNNVEYYFSDYTPIDTGILKNQS